MWVSCSTVGLSTGEIKPSSVQNPIRYSCTNRFTGRIRCETPGPKTNSNRKMEIYLPLQAIYRMVRMRVYCARRVLCVCVCGLTACSQTIMFTCDCPCNECIPNARPLMQLYRLEEEIIKRVPLRTRTFGKELRRNCIHRTTFRNDLPMSLPHRKCKYVLLQWHMWWFFISTEMSKSNRFCLRSAKLIASPVKMNNFV